MVTAAFRVWGRKALPSVYGLCTAGVVFAAVQEPTRPASPPEAATNAIILTNAAQIIELSPETAKANLPLRIRGIVTCYDPGMVLFVQDETAGVFVYYTGARLPLRPGQWVQVTGVANPGLYTPIIAFPSIQPWETGPVIRPQPVSLAQIYHGGFDAQWVELTGVIRTLKAFAGRLKLELADPPHRINVLMSDCQGYEQLPLLGSLVRLRGVVGASMNNRQQLERFQIFANTLSDVTVLRPSGADPFATPSRVIRDINAQYSRSGALGNVRVQGVVTLCWPGRALFIQDATGGLEVRTQTPLDGLVPGTAVDVAGFSGSVLGAPLIEDALIRKLGTRNAPPKPLRLLSENLLHGTHDHQLVEIDANFLGQTDSPSNCLTLALEADNRFLTALLAAPNLQGPLPALEPGCRVRLTGVWRSEAGSDVGSAVSLFLRSPMDIKVIKSPASARTFGLQALAAAALLTSVGLAMSLLFIQKQRRQTEHVLQLQSTLQSEMRQGEQQLRRSIEERERIGRDLHDDIIQSIYAVGLSLEDCRRVVRQSPDQADTRLAAAIHTLNNTIRSVRNFIAGLEPKVLNGREFKTALKSLALTSGDSPTQFQIEVDPVAANRLTSTQATQLLHIAKEAMSNCLRHAHASDVTVSLHPVGAGIRLEIHDDGGGFNLAAADGTGHGLRNMTARARQIEADLQIISALGEGCCIGVIVPHGNPNEHH